MLSKPKDEEVIEEDDWNLPSNFDLYSTHQIRKVYYSRKRSRQSSENTSRQQEPAAATAACAATPYFQVECIEPSSPLDILNKSQSLKKYDATGHCCWTGAFLLISCIDEVLTVIDNQFYMKNRSNEGDSSSLNENILEGSSNMIELGCGTGIGGLAVMLASNSETDDAGNGVNKDSKSQKIAKCCFTDYDPAVLEVCRRNCQLNDLIEGESYSIQELTWGDNIDCVQCTQNETQRFDIILATDVLYDVDLIPPLFSTVSKLLSINDNDDKQKNKNVDEKNFHGSSDQDNTSDGIFILSHVPRACYNDNNPPEAIEDLEQYIIDQAKDNYGLQLIDVIRPSSSSSIASSLECEGGAEKLLHNGIDSYSDSAILIFVRSNNNDLKR